jgi:hypothetical protein
VPTVAFAVTDLESHGAGGNQGGLCKLR